MSEVWHQIGFTHTHTHTEHTYMHTCTRTHLINLLSPFLPIKDTMLHNAFRTQIKIQSFTARFTKSAKLQQNSIGKRTISLINSSLIY